ncbi:endonuclease/exonuclease/phosphatase family protein [Streptomyces sp. NBC_01537]|uniref:endonuclease/exonuclease/phosphatase family protein n=1 Tax=Streptomyces sp. NBC_01537 TaxID=2903896 RepID=UPI00386F0541
MRVATLNIWCRRGPWADRLQLIRAGIRYLAPDVLALQEVIRDRDGCQAHELAAGLGYHVAYAPAAGRQGNALLSRHPVVAQYTLPLPGADRAEPRSLLCARLATPGGELPVYVTHLAWKANESELRQEQVRFITEHVEKEAPEGTAVLAGDFNACPGAPEITQLTTTGWTDAWAHAGDGTDGHTFDRANDYAREWDEPDQRLDYLFVREGSLTPRSTRLAFADPHDGVWPSDHFGVMTDLR